LQVLGIVAEEVGYARVAVAMEVEAEADVPLRYVLWLRGAAPGA